MNDGLLKVHSVGGAREEERKRMGEDERKAERVVKERDDFGGKVQIELLLMSVWLVFFSLWLVLIAFALVLHQQDRRRLSLIHPRGRDQDSAKASQDQFMVGGDRLLRVKSA